MMKDKIKQETQAPFFYLFFLFKNMKGNENKNKLMAMARKSL